MTRGSVLILGLWAMSVLTTLTVTQAGTLGTAARLLERHRDALEAMALAQHGLTYALHALEADETRTWDAPAEPWGQPQQGTLPAGRWSVTVTDEGGRMNLNTASPDSLARLPESSPPLVQAIVDRRAQRPFRHVAELALLPGMTATRLVQWAPFITVAGPGPVNLNSVGADGLEMLGLPASAAATFVAWRNGPDGALGTGDDHVFHDLAEIAPTIGPLLRPEESAIVMNGVAAGQIGVRSSGFQVVAVGVAGRSRATRTLTALIERQAPGAPSVIRGWHED